MNPPKPEVHFEKKTERDGKVKPITGFQPGAVGQEKWRRIPWNKTGTL